MAFKFFILFALIFSLHESYGVNIEGNKLVLTSIRPVTPFDKIQFKGCNQTNVKLSQTIYVFITFEPEGVEKLTIEADQNLQKFINVESDSEYLTINLIDNRELKNETFEGSAPTRPIKRP